MTLQKNNYYKFLFIFIAITYGCNKKELNVHEYLQYVQNPSNGLKVSKEIDQYKFELMYEPLEYLVLKENKENENISKGFLEESMREFGGMKYFVFRIKKKNASGNFLKDISSSVSDYMAYSEYFSVSMQKDLSLLQGDKSCKCVLFHTEPQNGISGQIVIVLGFESSNVTEDMTFTYDDKLFGNGPIKLTIDKDDLINIPKLKTT